MKCDSGGNTLNVLCDFFFKLSLKILYNIIGLGIYKLPQILKEWDLI